MGFVCFPPQWYSFMVWMHNPSRTGLEVVRGCSRSACCPALLPHPALKHECVPVTAAYGRKRGDESVLWCVSRCLPEASVPDLLCAVFHT